MQNIYNRFILIFLSFCSLEGYGQLELEYENLYIEYDETTDIQSIKNLIMLSNTTDTSLYFHWEVGLDSAYQSYLNQGLLELQIADFNQSYNKFITSSCMVEIPNEIEPEQLLNQILLETIVSTPELWLDEKVTGFLRLLDLSCNEEITSMRFHIGNDLTSTTTTEIKIINVYPNPTNDIVYIESEEEIQSATVTDIKGTNMLTSTNSNSIDLSTLPHGLYFLQVSTTSQNSNIRIVKQ